MKKETLLDIYTVFIMIRMHPNDADNMFILDKFDEALRSNYYLDEEIKLRQELTEFPEYDSEKWGFGFLDDKFDSYKTDYPSHFVLCMLVLIGVLKRIIIIGDSKLVYKFTDDVHNFPIEVIKSPAKTYKKIFKYVAKFCFEN